MNNHVHSLKLISVETGISAKWQIPKVNQIVVNIFMMEALTADQIHITSIQKFFYKNTSVTIKEEKDQFEIEFLYFRTVGEKLTQFEDDANSTSYYTKLTPWNKRILKFSTQGTLYIKIAERKLLYNKHTKFPIHGNFHLNSLKRFQDKFHYGALIGSFDNTNWFALKDDQLLQVSPNTKNLYIRLNFEETYDMEGHLDVYHSFIAH